MPTPSLGTKGAQLDLLVKQGATLGPNATTLLDGTGSPIDITGCTVRAQIRLTPDAVTAAATAVCTLVTPAAGTFTWSFTAAETTALTCSVVDENEPESLYYWDMELLKADSTVVPLLFGDVRVFREITK